MRSFFRTLPNMVAGVSATALTTAFISIGSAQAEPTVATSISPIHSLAAKIMEGVGEPVLIVPPGASPHHYALRPSEARALDKADVVFWVGEDLEPFLERPLETLAEDARIVTLEHVDGTIILESREGGAWEKHRHDDEAHDHDHDHDDHAHDEHDHDEHGHDDHAHDEHDHDEHGHDDHAHEHDHHGVDPHLWLDPRNAQTWVRAMAATLAEEDPDNAATYEANAEAAVKDLDTLEQEIASILAPVKTQPYIVFHDAYQYFEKRFGLSPAGSVTLSDARTPSPARLKEVRNKIRETGAACVFAEPQFEPGVIDTIVEDTDARKGILDPLGATIPNGPAQYNALLHGLANALVACLES